MRNFENNQKGVVAILSIMAITVFAVAMLTTIHILSLSSFKKSLDIVGTQRAYAASESGINEGIYQVVQNPTMQSPALPCSGNPTVACFTLSPAQAGGATVQVYIEPNGFDRVITAVATDPTNKIRKLKVNVLTDTFIGGFNFAVMAGSAATPGGFIMDNNSLVRGAQDTVTPSKYHGAKVYLNGNISGGNKNNTTIIGNVFASSASPARSIQDVSIKDDDFHTHAFGNVHVQTLNSTNIDETAFATTVSGTSYTLLKPYDNPAVPTDYPITNTHIQDFKNFIPVTNVVAGPLNIGANETLGETVQTSACNIAPFNCKINGNVTLSSSNVTWMIKSNIVWITGDLIMQNPGDAIRLDAALAGSSTMVIVDGKITIKNGGQGLGSGDPRSFVVFISTKNDLSNNVIEAANNGDQAVFFAPNGIIEVLNGGNLSSATGYKIHIDNNAIVTYNPNLAFLTIPPTTPVIPAVTANTWQEL